MEQIEAIYKAVLDGDAPSTQTGVKAALNVGIAADQILKEGLISAMDEVGLRFENGDFYVPEMLVAARAMQSGLSILKPLLAESGISAAGKIAVGTVQGDLHDIGKNLVAMMLEGAGFEVDDLGVDVKPETFEEAVRRGAQVIGLSALLTTTMINMEKTLEVLNASGLRSKVKIMIGGAPVTASYAQKIGADGYAPDASQAVTLARSLIG